MRRQWHRSVRNAFFAMLSLLVATTVAAAPTGKLRMYFVDVEGGQSTLIVTPAGESMLVDTGYPGFNGRDADRVAAAVKAAGLDHLDYLFITHYHADHVGGAPEVVARIPVRTFVDHGPNTENSGQSNNGYAAYEKLWANARRIVVKPGDTVPLRGVTVEVVASAGKAITKPLAGAGQTNPLCASEPAAPEDATENAQSAGFLLTYGTFRFIDLGDLTRKKELALVCPANLIGRVDLYLTTHHGFDVSNARAIVHALRPRVAIMNNGPHKGGNPGAWQIVHDSPGLKDLWQLHYAVDSDAAHNVNERQIANNDEKDDGKPLIVTASPDGTFTVENVRNGYSRTYKK